MKQAPIPQKSPSLHIYILSYPSPPPAGSTDVLHVCHGTECGQDRHHGGRDAGGAGWS